MEFARVAVRFFFWQNFKLKIFKFKSPARSVGRRGNVVARRVGWLGVPPSGHRRPLGPSPSRFPYDRVGFSLSIHFARTNYTPNTAYGGSFGHLENFKNFLALNVSKIS